MLNFEHKFTFKDHTVENTLNTTIIWTTKNQNTHFICKLSIERIIVLTECTKMSTEGMDRILKEVRTIQKQGGMIRTG